MAGKGLMEAGKKAASVIASNPDVLQKVAAYYKTATGKALPGDTSALQAIASRGPAPASILLRGAAIAGINPDDIFEDVILKGQGDAATQRIVSELQAVYSTYRGKMDAEASVRAGGNLADALFKKEVIMFARQKFGSPAAIREAHAKMRAFLHMDTAALEEQLALHLN